MPSEAQKKASKKYINENIYKVQLQLNRKTDLDIINKLEKCQNKNGYIKDAIRDKMSRND